MTDQRLRELLDERVADTTTVDLVSGAWERASAVRRRRRAVVGTAVAVVAIVGATTVVVSGDGDEPPPTNNTTETPAPGPKAQRGQSYAGVPVWWAPSVDEEDDLPALTGTALPPEIDLSEGAPPVPAGIRAVGLFQLWGDEPGRVVVVGADGGSYSLDISGLEQWEVRGENRPPVTQQSLSPDGRYAFFAQNRSLEVYDFDTASWTTIRPGEAYLDLTSWSNGLLRIWRPAIDPDFSLYEPSGRLVDRSETSLETLDTYVAPRSGDDVHGPIKGFRDGGARGLNLAGPLSNTDGTEMQSVEAVGVSRMDGPGAVLAFPREPDGRWNQCCPVVGWSNSGTLLFESRHSSARILAWRVGRPDMWRVSDIRGWVPGEESYVASFADPSFDGS